MALLTMPHEAGGAEAWDRLTLGGQVFTGLATVTGDAFKKKIDKRKAAGSDGARIVDKGFDLVDLTLTLVGWLPEHAVQIESLLALIAPRGGARGRGRALDVSYASLAAAGITQVYVTGATLPVADEGKVTWTIRATEYRDPGPTNRTRRAVPAAQTSDRADIDPQIAAAFRNNPIPRPSASGAAAPVPAPPTTP